MPATSRTIPTILIPFMCFFSPGKGSDGRVGDAAHAAGARIEAHAHPGPGQSAAAQRETRKARRALAEKPAGLRAQVSGFLDDIGAGLGCGIVYFSLLPAWWGGQTVGKKFLRLRVVELTGKPLMVMHALKRYGGYAAGLATGGVGFLQLLWDPNRQGLHDKDAHTVVVDRRPAALPQSGDA